MTKQEREQLEALEMYLHHEGQRTRNNMLNAKKLADSEYFKGRCSGLNEVFHFIHDFLEGRMELPEG
jgi:hypothetical protein